MPGSENVENHEEKEGFRHSRIVLFADLSELYALQADAS